MLSSFSNPFYTVVRHLLLKSEPVKSKLSTTKRVYVKKPTSTSNIVSVVLL